jgi:hypothetical protein
MSVFQETSFRVRVRKALPERSLVVRDCVGYRSQGHGFFLEDGTEVCNVLDCNLAVQAFTANPLPKQAIPFDHNDGAVELVERAYRLALCRLTGDVGLSFSKTPPKYTGILP